MVQQKSRPFCFSHTPNRFILAILYRCIFDSHATHDLKVQNAVHSRSLTQVMWKNIGGCFCLYISITMVIFVKELCNIATNLFQHLSILCSVYISQGHCSFVTGESLNRQITDVPVCLQCKWNSRLQIYSRCYSVLQKEGNDILWTAKFYSS